MKKISVSFRESKMELKRLVNVECCYLEYGKHEDLKTLCVLPFAEDEEPITDWHEMIFVVPKEWLLKTVKEMYRIKTEKAMQYWLESEYTTDESESIFERALNERKVVMIDFY